jgi:hypothetical protein
MQNTRLTTSLAGPAMAAALLLSAAHATTAAGGSLHDQHSPRTTVSAYTPALAPGTDLAPTQSCSSCGDTGVCGGCDGAGFEHGNFGGCDSCRSPASGISSGACQDCESEPRKAF